MERRTKRIRRFLKGNIPGHQRSDKSMETEPKDLRTLSKSYPRLIYGVGSRQAPKPDVRSRMREIRTYGFERS